MSEETSSPKIPPYVVYSTFANFLKGLKEEEIPERIDRSVMTKMSGGQQGAIIATLKFFDLIDGQSVPTQALRDLVEADEQGYPVQLKELLKTGFAFLTADGLNLERATGAQVAERFRAIGITGSTVTKAIAFYIAAAKVAGIKLSSHIKPPPIAKSNGSARRSRTRDEEIEDDDDPPLPPRTAAKSWHEQLLEKFPGFDPTWSDETKTKWFDAFDRLMKQGAEKKEGQE